MEREEERKRGREEEGCMGAGRRWYSVPGVSNDIRSREVLHVHDAGDPVSPESLSKRDGSRPVASVWHVIGDIDYKLSYAAGNL